MLSAGEVRRDFIHSHGIVLHALGRVGQRADRVPAGPGSAYLAAQSAEAGQGGLAPGKPGLWEGRAMLGGRVCKAHANVLLTTAAIRGALGLPLPPAEQRAEDAFRGGET